MADTFYTNAGCTLVAMNPFKPSLSSTHRADAKSTTLLLSPR